MTYTKHIVKRTRDLNEKYFEIVFQKESLNFKPGDCVTIWNGPQVPVFIASGVQEPWVRLILNRDLFRNFYPLNLSIRLDINIECKLPELINAKNPSFVFDTRTIGAFFSWASTFPGKKCRVMYLGEDRIQEEWISGYHDVVDNVSKIKHSDELYVTGNRDLFTGKLGKLLKVCKESYIIPSS